MKNVSIKPLVRICLAVFLFMSVAPGAMAQTPTATSQLPYKPGKGSWRIFTDPHARCTIIKFYNTTNQPIYEEVIRGQYIKLTKRNVRLLEQTLDRLTGNQLVAAQIKGTELLEQKRASLQDVPDQQLRDDLKVSKASLNESSAGLCVNPHLLTRSNKMRLAFVNPQQEKVNIWLKDGHGAILYQELTSLPSYFRQFDFKGMDAGLYTLVVEGKELKLTRQVELNYQTPTPHLSLVTSDETTAAQVYRPNQP